jgi:hypothetical protein
VRKAERQIIAIFKTQLQINEESSSKIQKKELAHREKRYFADCKLLISEQDELL